MMLRNTSEELLIRSLLDGSTVNNSSLDNMNMGFVATSSFRVDSEELFNSWITNAETSAHGRPLQKRKSTELTALLAQQQSIGHGLYDQHNRGTNGTEGRRAQQDYPSLQTLSWFQSSQPMTRSRSTELRRRYMEMQRQGAQNTGFSEQPWPDNHIHQQEMQVSSVTNVVNMLKGTLEKKKLMARNQTCIAPANVIDLSNTNGETEYILRNTEVYTHPLTPSESGDNSCPATPNHLRTSNSEIQADETHKRHAQLSRAGSITSSGRSALNIDTSAEVSTKKRRVERKRMMVEAKGRPSLPSDMQAAAKRLEALEKEVRSLKLNLSFMNRKDSEQTKRIEELEKENLELINEKRRLHEELEQLLCERTW